MLMKILHVNTYDYGGAAIAAIRLHKALLSEGIDSSMLFLYKSNSSIPNTYAYEIKRKKEPVFIVRQLLRIKHKLLPPPIPNYIINQHKLINKPVGFKMFSFNPTDFDITTQKCYQEADIIHMHWIANFIDYNFFKKNAKPVVWTLHDMNPFTGGCHYSDGCDRYKTDCMNCPQLQGTIDDNNAFFDQEYKKSCLSMFSPIITAPSQWLKECSFKSKLFGTFKNQYIPYSLDMSIFKFQDKAFCRTIFNLPQDKKIILFVSDSIDNRRKGFDILLDSFKQLQNADIHICVVGDKKWTIDYPLEITFLGRINDERLMALVYSAADAFILPSREDNLPNVIIESLACGTPVIAFPVGGVIDIIKTGFNGIIVNDVFSENLTSAIMDFIEEKYSFDHFAIRNDAIFKFSSKIQAEQYLTLYTNIL